MSPITISESQTVPTTGHGHQDAARAMGTLTFYNGLSTAQAVQAGTVFTGQDGVQVRLTQTVEIPTALPPQFGEATAIAAAANPGAAGNIPAFDVSTDLSSSLTVKNLAAFSGGQDARDFQIVRKTDVDAAASNLRAKVTASMTAALQQQLTPTEQMQKQPCSPTATADHKVGDEAAAVTITVALTCSAIAYDSQQLHALAMRLLNVRVKANLGAGYTLYGSPTVTVMKVDTQNKSVLLTFTCQANWIYQINEATIQALVSGKPRLEALQLLKKIPGIRRVSISGVAYNDTLPTDAGHIKFLLIYATF